MHPECARPVRTRQLFAGLSGVMFAQPENKIGADIIQFA